MRNDNTKLPGRILSVIADLPFFSVDNLKILGVDEGHLLICLSRLAKQEKITRIKKGWYGNPFFQLKHPFEQEYRESLGCVLKPDSYLSLEFVLSSHHLLTDVIRNITYVTSSTPRTYRNQYGVFNFHKIRPSLFYGFETYQTPSGLLIRKAEKSKALFDFLYLRKNILNEKSAVSELRLNMELLNKKDLEKTASYVYLEGSDKMKTIWSWISE